MYQFTLKDSINLSYKHPKLLSDFVKNKGVLLSKGLLTYTINQAIQIQISTNVDYADLRGIGLRLDDYTYLQLLHFIDAQNIELELADILYRLWSVILQADFIQSEDEVNALLNEPEHRLYFHDGLEVFSCFSDEIGSFDGQILKIAKDSLLRFSTEYEVIDIAKQYNVSLENKRSKEGLVSYITYKLDDHTESFIKELQSYDLDELEEYAKVNFVFDENGLTKQELVETLLIDMESKGTEVYQIDYMTLLDIPSLGDDERSDEHRDFEVPDDVDLGLSKAISDIINDQNSMTEDEAKQALDSVVLMQTGGVKQTDEALHQMIAKLEQELKDTNDRLKQEINKRIEALEDKMVPKDQKFELAVIPSPKEEKKTSHYVVSFIIWAILMTVIWSIVNIYG